MKQLFKRIASVTVFLPSVKLCSFGCFCEQPPKSCCGFIPYKLQMIFRSPSRTNVSSDRRETAQHVQSLTGYILYRYLSGVFCWIFLSILRFFSSIKWFRDDSHPLHPLTAHKHTFTLFHRREESPRAKPHTHTPAPRSCSPGRSATALRVCVYYYSKVFNLAFFLSLSSISVFLSHTHTQSILPSSATCHMKYNIHVFP